MAVIPKSPFPNVPKLPGVPQLRRSLTLPSSVPPALGVPLALSRFLGFGASRGWGFFNSENRQILTPDSVVDFNLGRDFNLPTFPVQAGQFAAYNKVQLPAEYVVRMSKGGDDAARLNFLVELDVIAESDRLYTIITPERIYKNVNVKRYEITRRGANGAYWLAEVDVYFQQIRQVQPSYTTSAQLTQNAQAPSAKPPVSLGHVQLAPAPRGVTYDPFTGTV